MNGLSSSPPSDSPSPALAAQNGNGLFRCMSNNNNNGSDDNTPPTRTLRNSSHECRSFNKMERLKNKETVVDEERLGLHVMIMKAEIDVDDDEEEEDHLDDYSRRFHHKHFYNVVYWIVPGEEIRTKITEGVKPTWNERGMVVIEESIDDYVFLNVEVQRFNSISDPGTSNGRVVVGRVKIPFPKELYRKRIGSFSLVKNKGEAGNKLAGKVVVGMRLERI
ncbi:hypothetical protein PIB30_088239 [Stylosanthes scabra]|uniref:C2 domain-containing protein n=1 Tax=Stylosanthes scabra TaxID=79078 RepID=A0ABU6UW33_9FABA|nr:hypothetical protein [Stylosanthes scabra]